MLNPGKYLSALLDLIFWGLCALLAFQYLLAGSTGVRAYMGLARVVGVCAEQLAVGDYVRRLCFAILRLLVKTLRAAITALAGTADALGGAVAWPLLRIVRHVRTVICLAQKAKIFSRKAGKSREPEK